MLVLTLGLFGCCFFFYYYPFYIAKNNVTGLDLDYKQPILVKLQLTDIFTVRKNREKTSLHTTYADLANWYATSHFICQEEPESSKAPCFP